MQVKIKRLQTSREIVHKGMADVSHLMVIEKSTSCVYKRKLILNVDKQVLDLESTNVKALYRRTQAYIQLADLDLAEFDIKKALELEPNNR